MENPICNNLKNFKAIKLIQEYKTLRSLKNCIKEYKKKRDQNQMSDVDLKEFNKL